MKNRADIAADADRLYGALCDLKGQVERIARHFGIDDEFDLERTTDAIHAHAMQRPDGGTD